MTTEMGRQQLLEVETTCGSLLNELQIIWDEVGESDEERDKLLLQLEQECLDVYRRKVDQANLARAHLRQALADVQTELASLSSTIGERPPLTQLETRRATLKEQLAALLPLLEDMRQRKEEHLLKFREIKGQIQRIQCEISGSMQSIQLQHAMEEHDLSLRRLDELHEQFRVLQKEKNDRLYKVLEYVNTVHELCAVLGLDFLATITKVHPSLNESSGGQAKSISNETIECLAKTIFSLREEKRRRMQKLQDLGASLIELWNLMDTPIEEQQLFQHVTCNIAAAEYEVTAPGMLSIDAIEQVDAEVQRLDCLKSSKLKELVLKKRTELEEICRKAHIIPDANTATDKSIASMESGMVDPADLLASIEEQIGKAKEEAFSRKEIMEKVDKWMGFCEEECWLEEYNQDENRYNASKGAHINLKRAERARATLSKIPALVDSLIAKTKSWEEERGKLFLYDGVRLLSTLEEYSILRLEKEEEKRRQRDQRRLHEQLMNEQETLFGTKPSPNNRTPSKRTSASKANGTTAANTPTSRRLSLGGTLLQFGGQDTSTNRIVAPLRTTLTPAGKESRKDSKARPAVISTAGDEFAEDTKTAGFKLSANLQQQAFHNHETDANPAPVARQPLSPVSTPITRLNVKNTVEDSVKSCHIWSSSPMKTPLALTPLKQQQRAAEAENAATPANFSSPAMVVVDGNNRFVMTDEENSTPFQTSKQQSYHQLQQHSTEFSFEERRFGFCHRNVDIPPYNTTWAQRADHHSNGL
eukprot:c23068_g2_i1 orf=84-2363(-)